jgi:hypothetical protein
MDIMPDEDEIENEVATDSGDEILGEEIETDDLTEIVDADFDPEADSPEGDDFDPDALTAGESVIDLSVDGATVLSDEGSTLTPTDPTKPKSDDDDDDDDLRTEDDVEADLSSILQDKLASPQETAPEEDEEIIGDDRTDGVERLQPRRPDETQCSHCFLLVRQTAPGCPVEDDACPLFVH